MGNKDACKPIALPDSKTFQGGKQEAPLQIIQELKDYIRNSEKLRTVFLFAWSPLSNYLITEIWKETQDHFLLDIGSAIDDIQSPHKGFHSGKGGYGKFCGGTIEMKV